MYNMFFVHSSEYWTLVLNSHGLVYIAEAGRGYQAMMMDKKKNFKMAVITLADLTNVF